MEGKGSLGGEGGREGLWGEMGELEEEDEVGIERVVGGLVKGKVEKGVVEGDG